MQERAASRSDDDATLAQLDTLIADFDSRGWTSCAAKLEEVVNDVYRLLGRTMPASRIAALDHALEMKSSKKTQ